MTDDLVTNFILGIIAVSLSLVIMFSFVMVHDGRQARSPAAAIAAGS
jgi:hypothetical protein